MIRTKRRKNRCRDTFLRDPEIKQSMGILKNLHDDMSARRERNKIIIDCKISGVESMTLSDETASSILRMFCDYPSED